MYCMYVSMDVCILIARKVELIKADLDAYIMSNSGSSADRENAAVSPMPSPERGPCSAEKSPGGVPFSQYNATRKTNAT